MYFMSSLSRDIERARKANLPEYLIKHGYALSRVGQGNYRWPGLGGMIIKDNFWHCFSTDEKGNAIDFLVKILGMDFKKAVFELVGYSPDRHVQLPVIKTIKELEIPVRAQDERRVIAYLIQKRRLPLSLVMDQIRAGRLYQDLNGNCVFPCLDYDNKLVGAILRGTSDKRYAGLCPGHNPLFGWRLPAANQDLATVTIFESPIDALSYIVLQNCQAVHSHVLAMAGVRVDAVLKYLTQYPGVKQVILAVDHDDAGDRFCEKIIDAAAELDKGKYSFDRQIPKLKDWNLDLQAQN